MNEQMNEQTLQDQHLDMMIRLAFLKDEEEAVQQILDEPDPTLTLQEEIMANQAFHNALQIAEANNRREKITRFASKTKIVVPRIIQVAACIVLIIGIATPIAIAASPQFRSRVMQLLLEIDNEKKEAHFSFQEDDSAAFYVPDSWRGNYFPSYIPDGFIVNYSSSVINKIELVSSRDERIVFSEYDETTGLSSGIEEASVSSIKVNGTEGYMIESDSFGIHSVTITWAASSEWFELTSYGLDTSESVHIAESVKKINQ